MSYNYDKFFAFSFYETFRRVTIKNAYTLHVPGTWHVPGIPHVPRADHAFLWAYAARN